MKGPCAKVDITVWIVAKSGRVYIGKNDCYTPQTHCPREPGEDYRKCFTICWQEGHAEEMALAEAKARGEDLTDAHAYVYPTYPYCRKCQGELIAAGVTTLHYEPYIYLCSHSERVT